MVLFLVGWLCLVMLVVMVKGLIIIVYWLVIVLGIFYVFFVGIMVYLLKLLLVCIFNTVSVV